jgi:putative PEP-CTERM system TPR-repeat lipoprotein
MEKAVEIRPNRPQDRAKLGITKIVLGNSEEGVQDLDSFLEGVESPTAQSARAFLRAYRAGNYLEALTAARALRKESTDNPLPLTLIGLARLALKDNGGAAEAFSEALKLDYDFVPAITGMGALAMQQGNLQAALEQYEKAQRLKPNRLLVLLRLAQVQLKLGKEFEAVGYLEQAVQKYPTALTPRILLGQIQFRSGHPDRALALTAEMVEHYPANPGLLEVVGRAQMATNHKAEAVATFRKLVEILPNSPASHYYLAVAYRNLGDAARYGSSLDKSLALDPKYFRALMEKARFKLAENKLAESRKLVDEIKANNPNRADVLELDGTLALAEGHLDTSVETLKRAYDMVGNTRVVIQLAQAYWLSGRQDDALALMKGWLAKVPADTRVRLKYANLLLALNKVKEAHGHLEAVVEAAPNNVLARNNLAWTLHRLGRDSSALLHAEKALELAPGNPGVMDTLGVILMGQGKSDEALVLLRRAAKAQSDIPAVQYHYAKALAKAGQRQEAVRILTSVLGDKQISFAEIDDAKALLQTLKKK